MSASPLIDRRHLDFILHDLLDVGALCALPRFSEHSREGFDAVIESAHRLALAEFLPHNRKSDLNEPQMVDGRVVLIPEIASAVAAYNEAGFCAALADAEDGGLQLPFVIASACDALFAGANPGTVAYPSLARAAANLLAVYGDARQKRLYMRPIVAGRWFGTMCLSEPQAGSSLGDISTSAEMQPDGSYRLRGAKMWISAGDHELGDNIVHLVLARVVGAPAGVRGISLFLVPRFRVNEDGSLGARNDVRLAGLNHKLGQRGSVNTFLKFGEAGDCYGELVGQPNQGLAAMFHMMNEERIAVGTGAVMNGSVGYQYSLQYARERRQGRHPDQRDPASPPIPLIEHADVRRMLLIQKSVVEANQALCLYAAWLVDQQQHGGAVAKAAEARLELLTPIVKAWGSDQSLEANNLAIQILGGYGYTREYPVEQCWRDNRINPIHEGTNGIQALDLLGRKCGLNGGTVLADWFVELRAEAQRSASVPELIEPAQRFSAAISGAESAIGATLGRMAAGQVRRELANAEQAMVVLGNLCSGWMWLWMARLAAERLAAGDRGDQDFYRGKIATCRFFFSHRFPSIDAALRLLGEVDDSVIAVPGLWL